ncbi:MAG: hypothetical protein ABJA64_00355 [Candidatus Saccharibacteria bacterium]
MSEQTNYIPGICNINPKEIKNRRMTGYFGLAAVALMLALFLTFDLDHWIRLAIFAPAFLSATGFLQAKNKFCVGFAGAKMHHADDGEAVKITDNKSLLLDRIKARKINLQAFGIAILVTIITLLLPAL